MTDAQITLAAYIQAERDILAHGQSSAIEGRTLTHADLDMVQRGRREWERKVAAEGRVAAGRPAMGYSVARFD